MQGMKIIIADDEKWVRATIKALIPFDRLGMELAGEAANGIEALELCRLHEPDILLTDIMMPGLTGLDLIKELKRSRQNIRIAIISGYSDFEYAKTAMKYGITDYLLKPLEENELLQVLEKFKSERNTELEQQKDNAIKKEQLKLAAPVLRDVFLNSLISQNNFTLERIKNGLAAHGLVFSLNTFHIAVFSPDTGSSASPGQHQDNVRAVLKRTMKRYLNAVTFSNANNPAEYISIINCKDELDKVLLEKAFRLAGAILRKQAGVTLSGGLSAPCQLSMLHRAYSQTKTSLLGRFRTGGGKIHYHRPGYYSKVPDLQLSEETVNKIVLNLKLSNVQTAFSHVDSTIEDFKKKDGINPVHLKEYLWQLVQSIISSLNIQLAFMHSEAQLYGEQPYERIMDTLFADDLAKYVKELLQRVYNYFHDSNPVSSTNLIDNSKKIIEENFAGDISLEQVAKHVHLSPAYLSELFKKETGMSFIDYKTIVRIEKAKELLASTAYSVYEISGRVGYADPKYFSKLFKKITGRTVYDYRKEIGKKA